MVLPVSKLSTDQPADHVGLGFMDSRAKLIDIAAFLDRVQRHGQDGDFRVKALKEALGHLESGDADRAKKILLHFSDPSSDPIPVAQTQGASGAFEKGE